MKKAIKNKLDKVFSLYIRLKDANVDGFTSCVTCGKYAHFKELQCGHFQSRRHMSTRWDEDNCNVQCSGCNVFKHGEQFLHAKYIDKKHGKGFSDKLVTKANTLTKFSDNDGNELYRNIVERVREQQDRLNIKVL